MIAVGERLSGQLFRLVHGTNLVYNTCWEDPRLDRIALGIRPHDQLLVITSAGCNALDYALLGPQHVYAVDLNPRQNALLELKIAGIRQLDFADFFEMFGHGRLPKARAVYEQKLRQELSPWAQRYWDHWIRFFENPKRSFYFRGTSGMFARFFKLYADRVARVRPFLDALLETHSLDEQRAIYEEHLRDRVWGRGLRFAMKRDATLSLLGVPRAQRRQLEDQYEGGLLKFILDCLDAVFGELPLADNYFWRVYIAGSYTRDCCPAYLQPDNFQQLKSGLIDRISVHTDSVQGFLENHPGRISRYVLLDHMDWLADRFFPLLEAEWQAIADSATADARIIWRSAGLRTDFLDRVSITSQGRTRWLPEVLQPHEELARMLHPRDRVHTYGSFHIADLCV